MSYDYIKFWLKINDYHKIKYDRNVYNTDFKEKQANVNFCVERKCKVVVYVPLVATSSGYQTSAPTLSFLDIATKSIGTK